MSSNRKDKSSRGPLAASTSKIKSGGSLDSFTASKQAVQPLLYKKQNYLLMIGGIVLMCLGYVLMAGGSMPDANTWDPDIIYSTRRTLIAPIFILAGLGLEVWAVFKK